MCLVIKHYIINNIFNEHNDFNQNNTRFRSIKLTATKYKCNRNFSERFQRFISFEIYLCLLLK